MCYKVPEPLKILKMFCYITGTLKFILSNIQSKDTTKKIVEKKNVHAHKLKVTLLILMLFVHLFVI